MYSARTGLILAFHGCDESVVKKVLKGQTSLRSSTNQYDWLGHGVYFWDNSPSRALEFATFLSKNPSRSKNKINKPAIIGAVVNLGYCLDLLDFENLSFLKEAYKLLKVTSSSFGKTMPINKKVGTNKDLLLRELDLCSN